MSRQDKVNRARRRDTEDAKRKPIFLVMLPLMLDADGIPTNDEQNRQTAGFFSNYALLKEHYIPLVMVSAQITEVQFSVLYAPVYSKAKIANMQAIIDENMAQLSKDFAQALKVERELLALKLQKAQCQAKTEIDSRFNKMQISVNKPDADSDAEAGQA